MELRPGVFNQQRQSTAITAQVIQSIKMLQFSRDELHDYLRDQAERNPLIDLDAGPEGRPSQTTATGLGKDKDVGAKGTGFSERSYLGAVSDGRSRRAGGGEVEARSLEEYCAATKSLQDVLRSQVAIAFSAPADCVIGMEIVESVDPDGYLRRDLGEIADFLGVAQSRVEAILAVVQTFEPTGVAARDLAECLRVQLHEAGRLTRPVEALLENLGHLADCNIPHLARLCGVPESHVVAMAGDLRKLDPRPGRRYDNEPVLPAFPDVQVELLASGAFAIHLNASLLPRVLVNQQYYAEIAATARGQDEARYLTDCIRNAHWLARNLHQRAQTILKVATEIVLRQKDFLLHGIEHLKPLCLRDVAQAIGMHESTVCRAIANKHVLTNRGMFELKFFFASSIASSRGEDFAAATIREKIRQLVGAETMEDVLSDDEIMTELRRDGAEIARRTVAKYREQMNIPSSLKRKRQKRAERWAAPSRELCVSA